MQVRNHHGGEVEQLHAFLCAHGWSHRIGTPEAFGRLLDASQRTAVAAVDGQIVGFARAITDGISNGYLSMVVVAPEHRRRGVGSAIVRHILGEDPGITWVLRAGRNGAPEFFGKLGFEASTRAMERSRV